jgi:hypothetical protein
MKPLLYYALLFLISCHSKPDTSTPRSTTHEDSIAVAEQEKDKAFRKKLYVTTDSVVISIDEGDTNKYAAQEINDIIDHFPRLYDTFPKHPDISYAESRHFYKFADSNGKEKTITFSSEAGQDGYYMLYAYFLRKRNGEETLAGRRDTLIRIYQHLNNIMGRLVGGGTYFMHQYPRIPGYAEYDLYLYLYDWQGNPYYINYDNTIKQKQLYIALLRQKIMDRVNNDGNIRLEDKKELQQFLFEELVQIKNLITDQFYLESTIKFQYSCY